MPSRYLQFRLGHTDFSRVRAMPARQLQHRVWEYHICCLHSVSSRYIWLCFKQSVLNKLYSMLCWELRHYGWQQFLI